MNYLIDIQNLRKTYTKFSLNIDNFKLKEGEIKALVGRNGAGKTTFLKSILGQVKPNCSNLNILSEKYLTSKNKQEMGFSFSNDNFFNSNFSVNEIELIMKNIYKNWDSKSFFSFLVRFGINKDSRIKELSTGMKVKLNLAIAISHWPKILILDEITSGLDPFSRKEILEILKEYRNGSGVGILFSTHIIEDVPEIADSIAILNNGKVNVNEELSVIHDHYEIVSKNDISKTDKIIYKQKYSEEKILRYNDDFPQLSLPIDKLVDFCISDGSRLR